jgi:hypothetical protein
MKAEAWKPTSIPLYGCVTGLELPEGRIEILQGITLRPVYVDTIGATMMAFAPPPTPQSHHPAPWAAVRGGFTFESRLEIAITDIGACDGLPPSVVAWLVAALLRLRVASPIRLAVIANMPFDQMGERSSEVEAVAFESAPQQIGAFTARRVEATESDLSWLREMLPVAARLYHDERFFRAFSIYDQALFSPTTEMGTVLVWTAIETLFDLGREREKTKAICRALSDYVGADRADRDRAYQVIQELYYKRGQTVHAGRGMDTHDMIQSYRLACGAFQRALIDGKLPPTPTQVLH